MKENVILLFGGRSVEHDISIITALQTMSCVSKEYNLIPVYIDRNGKWCIGEKFNEVDTFIDFESAKKKEVSLIAGSQFLYLKKIAGYKRFCHVDCAIMCLHGGEGEDGSVASLLSMCDIPYTSAGHTSSAICMDKIFAKQVLSANGVSNVPFEFFTDSEFLKDEKCVLKKIKTLGYPVIIKPANLGSSVAIDVAKTEKEVKEKIELALEFDNRILVEKYLQDCEEYNCACMVIDGDVIASKVVAVDKGEIFSFDEKYLENHSKKEKKSEKSVQKSIKTLAKDVYALLDCAGVVRIDFLVKDEKIYVNEVNTIPGSLSMHMFPTLSRREIVDALIKDAKDRFAKKKNLTLSFKSEALSYFKSAINNAKMSK